MFEDQARAKGLSLSVSLAEDLPPVLTGDAGKIRQILFNLMGNAVKFTDAGEVRVRLDCLPRRAAAWCCSWRWPTPGWASPRICRRTIFEPFTQAEAVYTKRFQGTGLGLAIVRRLVGFMDGGIDLVSRPGQGTSISLALRLTRPGTTPPAAAAAAPATAVERPLRLLLAEDNLISQLAAKSFLQRAGHEVVTAANGQEALDRLAEGGFDAVLMDIQMPVLDGVEATRRIRAGQHGGDPDIPIIALTAYAQAGEHRVFLEAGMDEAIAKPLEPAEILQSLGRVLARRGRS